MNATIGLWALLANSIVPFFVGIFAVAMLVKRKKHTDADGELARRRIGALFLTSFASYVFVVLLMSYLFSAIVPNTPTIGMLIDSGFKNAGFAGVLLGASTDYVLRSWSRFFEKAN